MFTDKEIEVAKLRKQGLKQVEIAQKLGISQPAVSAFEQGIYRKIDDSAEVLKILKEMGIDLGKYRKKN